MKIQEKPDYLIFAESAKKGEVSDFPDVSRGWGVTIEQTGSKPPMEWMNGAFNRVDKNMLYLLQQGVPEWSENVKYPVNAIIKYNGVLYTAISENDNSNPATSTTKWKKTQEKIANASTSQSGVVKLNSATNSESENEAATPLAVKRANDNANSAHNRISNVSNKFGITDFESAVFSGDKNYRFVVRNDGRAGVYCESQKKFVWFFTNEGWVDGLISTERVGGLDQFVRDRCVPVGIPLPWPQTTPPGGWFECNGSQFNTNWYPRLAAAYPNGRLPDLRGEFIRGWDHGRRADPDRAILSWQSDAIRNIWGSIFGTNDPAHGFIGDVISTGGTFRVNGVGRKQALPNQGGPTWGCEEIIFDPSIASPISHDNHPRNVAFMYIVKAE